jgi:hypothetical protein
MKKMFFPFGAMLAAMIAGTLSGCATDKNVYKDIDAGVGSASYDKAVDAIVKGQEGKTPIYPEKDAILLYLDKGVVEHYAGKYPDSAKDLEQAQTLINDAYTKSVSQDVVSYLANDNVKDYSGETYEDIYLNVFNALNYYNNGDIEGAGVEVRRVSQKLKTLANTGEEKGFKLTDLITGFSKAVQVAEESGLTLGVNLPVPTPVNELTVSPGDSGADFMLWVQQNAGKKVSDSALARYLSAIIYRGIGKDDDARIDFKALGNISGFDASAETAVDSGKARINIIGFSGLSPEKTMYVQAIPLYDVFPVIRSQWDIDRTVGFGLAAVPVLTPRRSAVDRVEVLVNGQTVNLNLLEDIGGLMKSTLAEKFDNVYYKAYIQALVRYIAVEVAGKTAKDKGVPDMAVKLAVVGAKKSADALAQADVRSARYFPDKAWAGGITVDPGKYTVTVNYYAGGTRVASVEKEINAAAGKANIVEAVSLK